MGIVEGRVLKAEEVCVRKRSTLILPSKRTADLNKTRPSGVSVVEAERSSSLSITPRAFAVLLVPLDEEVAAVVDLEEDQRIEGERTRTRGRARNSQHAVRPYWCTRDRKRYETRPRTRQSGLAQRSCTAGGDRVTVLPVEGAGVRGRLCILDEVGVIVKVVLGR